MRQTGYLLYEDNFCCCDGGTDLSKSAFGRLFRGLLIALLATAVGFAVETAQLADAQPAEGVIIALRPLNLICATCDSHEMIIEYSTPQGTRRFSQTRAVWDRQGAMNRIGTRLPVLYHADGRARVDRLTYTHPFTASLLVLDGLLALAWAWIATLGRKQFQDLEKQHADFRQAMSSGSRNIGRKRRQLLSELNRMLLVMGAGCIVSAIGFVIANIGLALGGLALILTARFYFGPRLKCSRCGGSLIADLRAMVPHIRGTTNWLVVRDALVKGVPLRCGHCDRDLDE